MPNENRTLQAVYSTGEIDYFETIGQEYSSRLLNSKIVKYYAKGDGILRRDDVSNYIYLVHDGLAKVVTYLVDGREFVMATSSSGGIFGELEILGRSKPLFEVYALTNCEIWALDGKIIKDALGQDPQLSRDLLYYVLRRITELESRVVGLTAISVASRLANTLIRLSSRDPNIGRTMTTINISQHQLASMLPASREKVNRCLREWERSRIVNLSPGLITITNPRALHSYTVC
ncbi:Crp/Fnr family transcriptional regulator [Rhizobium sp. RAF56]|jgi:CRP-like cAMP-binding protein|uniref:Crp/Fnr family transcriptional regulator n=1 Tax=Rhizobium sp. RAF56 TaxID=3233062 RepID=UPI003F9908ED